MHTAGYAFTLNLSRDELGERVERALTHQHMCVCVCLLNIIYVCCAGCVCEQKTLSASACEF